MTATSPTYAGGRRVLDADAHIMEPPGWLERYSPASIVDRLPPMDFGDPAFVSKIERSVELVDQRHRDPEEARAAAAEYLTMPRKGWGALGDHDVDERRAVLDLLGFEAQVVYPTGSFPQAMSSPAEVRVEAIEAMNRGMAAFCDTDRRMLSVAYLPMQHGVEVARRVLDRALADGCDVAAIDTAPPVDGPSPTHADFDPLWAALVDHDMPVTLHVGLDNGWRPVPMGFFDNGRELPHFRSDAPGDALSYMAIGFGPQLLLAAMVFDGVFHRHPGLRIGVAELGATWVPGFLHFIDHSRRAFRRLQDLTHLDGVQPSEVVRRHVCVAPFAGEDVGVLIESAGAELFVFSSDYPHHEGTDDPIRRFERTMPDVTGADRQQFYAGNLERLLGPRLIAQTGRDGG